MNDTQYDAAGRIVSRKLGTNVINTTYAYYPWDEQGGRLNTLQSTSAQEALQNLAYAYDDVGNITSIVDDALAGGTQTQSFTYDNLNRLHTASAVGGTEGAYTQETYEYDLDTGNLESKAGMTLNYGDADHKHAVTSTSNPTASYSYDANGNQVSRNINALTYDLAYDAENRLVGVSGATTASYVYDGDGVRVQAVESGATTTYVNSLYEVTENQPVSVPNSGFESSAWTTQGSSGFPATSFYRGGSGVAAPNSGNNSQTTSNLANGWVDSASISVSAGATYDVYAYLHGEFDANDSNGQWKIQVVYSGMVQLDPITVDSGSTVGITWQYEGGQVVVPAGMTSMKVRLVNETNSGWIAFDDLEVYLVKGGVRIGSNLISDAGFENTLSSWTTQVQAGFPGTAFYRGNSGIAAPHTGTYAYSISNLAYGTLESPNITVSASTSYTVYAYLRGELDAHDSNGSWTMRVKYYTSSGTYISQADVSTGTSLTTTWTLKGGTITTPSTAARMRVQFINQMNAGWLAVDDLAVKRSNWPVYIWGFDSDGTWTTSTQSGFSNTTSFYRGGSGIAAPRAGTSAYAISNLANGMLVSEAMVTIPSTTYTVNAYLHGEMDSVGSEGNWQINACFYKFDGAPSSCSILTSGSAPAANWTQVSGTVTSPADAATMKLELVGAQLSGWLAWDDVSVSLDTHFITKYYYAGSQRVAVRKNGVLNYLLGDHLGSASVVTDAGGSLLSKMLYKPWGEERYSSGVMPTDRLYTGQIAEPNLGLYFYNARWYDSSLSRFVQADSIIPGAGNPQSWDRYAAMNNNPIKYTDPSGHWYKPGERGMPDRFGMEHIPLVGYGSVSDSARAKLDEAYVMLGRTDAGHSTAEYILAENVTFVLDNGLSELPTTYDEVGNGAVKYRWAPLTIDSLDAPSITVEHPIKLGGSYPEYDTGELAGIIVHEAYHANRVQKYGSCDSLEEEYSAYKAEDTFLAEARSKGYTNYNSDVVFIDGHPTGSDLIDWSKQRAFQYPGVKEFVYDGYPAYSSNSALVCGVAQ